mmetsp:Transcript_47019/g.63990  ORF Transcript_47019/g.63990 Transcript_47019/m.63990 type:complete len:343 (+) Transcript_47019:392-1420(+)
MLPLWPWAIPRRVCATARSGHWIRQFSRLSMVCSMSPAAPCLVASFKCISAEWDLSRNLYDVKVGGFETTATTLSTPLSTPLLCLVSREFVGALLTSEGDVTGGDATVGQQVVVLILLPKVGVVVVVRRGAGGASAVASSSGASPMIGGLCGVPFSPSCSLGENNPTGGIIIVEAFRCAAHPPDSLCKEGGTPSSDGRPSFSPSSSSEQCVSSCSSGSASDSKPSSPLCRALSSRRAESRAVRKAFRRDTLCSTIFVRWRSCSVTSWKTAVKILAPLSSPSAHVVDSLSVRTSSSLEPSLCLPWTLRPASWLTMWGLPVLVYRETCASWLFAISSGMRIFTF